jgi:DHA2 family methylenomycin A resistance protein-like MFS transporter
MILEVTVVHVSTIPSYGTEGRTARRHAQASDHDPLRHRGGVQAWTALAVVAGGLFLGVLSTTVVSVALPRIGSGLRATPTDLQWTVDAYVLVYASLLVAGGVLGDRRGRKGIFLTGLSLFGVGSLICAAAPSVAVLLAGRVVQGLGPALLVPGSLAIIRATFIDERQRALAVGLWSTSSGLALALGPALGGVVVQQLGWRWVFLLGVPLSATLLILALAIVPRIAATAPKSRFDWLGATLTTTAIACLAFSLIEGQTDGWASFPIIGSFAISAVALVSLALWERSQLDPLIDVSLFLRPRFAAANVAALIVFFAFVGAIVYFSAYFQQVQGRPPIEAGLDVSAIGIAFALAAPLSGTLAGRIGPRWPMTAGLLLAAGAMLGLLRLAPGTPITAIWWNFALVGAGVGLCLTPMTSIALSAVAPARAGMASAVHNALRQLGQVLGVAVLGAVLYANLPTGTLAGSRLPHQQGIAFAHGLHNAMWISGFSLLGAALLTAVALSSKRPHRGRRPGDAPASSPAPAARAPMPSEFPSQPQE